MRLCLFIFIAILLAAPIVSPAEPTPQVDKILIKKADRKLYLLSANKIIREYGISLGSDPKGKKQKQGDGKTPEGIYKVSGRNPQSSYHKSLRIDYPNAQDLKNARSKGWDPGGDIMIHGLPNGSCAIGKAHFLRVWPLGCIAVTCEENDEILELAKTGTTVEIKP